MREDIFPQIPYEDRVGRDTAGPLLLDEDELLLLDWAICAASRLLPQSDDLDYLISAWGALRSAVWEALDICYPKRLKPGETGPLPTAWLDLNMPTARPLLAVLPTTFRWGTGEDVGYSLKRKLAQYLRGVYHADADKDQAGDEAKAPSQP